MVFIRQYAFTSLYLPSGSEITFAFIFVCRANYLPTDLTAKATSRLAK